MNQLLLVGNVGKDPETRKSAAGNSVVKFSLATKRPTAAKETDWHQCTAFGKTADLIAQYVHKGSLVGVQGSIQYTKLEDGRTFSEVIVDRIEFLGKREDSDAPPPPPKHPSKPDDMPF